MNDEAPLPPPVDPAPLDPEKAQRDWAMITHFSGLVCLLSVPSILGPLVCWLIKKDSMPAIDRVGKEAMNFQLTMLFIQIVSVPLVFIGIGFLTLIAAAICSIIFAIIAGVEASKGNEYVYPLTLRLFK